MKPTYTFTFRNHAYRMPAAAFWIAVVVALVVAYFVLRLVFNGWGNIAELYTGYRWIGYMVVLSTARIGINGVEYGLVCGRAGKWWANGVLAAGLIGAFFL